MQNLKHTQHIQKAQNKEVSQKNSLRLIVIMSVIFLLIVSCSPKTGMNTAETSKPFKIGFIAPLTGAGAAYGVPHLNAATLALDDLNAKGGINGKPVELIVEDAKCDAAVAVTTVTKLLEVDDVDIVLGGHCSTESLAIIPVMTSHKIFQIAGATGTDKFSGAGPYSFRTFPSAKVTYEKLGDFAYDQGSRKIALLGEQKDWPKSVINSFQNGFVNRGGIVVSEQWFDPGSQDLRTPLLKLQEANPDSIMISVQGPDAAAQIIKNIHELGMNITIYGDSLVVSEATYSKSGGLLPPTAIGATAHVNPEKSPLTKTVLDRYVKRFGQVSLDKIMITEGYDEVNLATELYKVCGRNADCSRKEIMSHPWVLATGTITFDEKGDPTPFFGITKIVNGSQVFLWESGGN